MERNFMIKIGDTTINPTKIICLGLNYQDHIDEFKRETPKEPVLFTKTLNCLITDGEPIIYPKILYNDRKNNQVDYEVELAFIIKDKCKNVPENEAYDHILGYTVFNGNDVGFPDLLVTKNGKLEFFVEVKSGETSYIGMSDQRLYHLKLLKAGFITKGVRVKDGAVTIEEERTTDILPKEWTQG